MERRITIIMDLDDWDLAQIVPSGTIWVEMGQRGHEVVSGQAEIIQVEDIQEST